MIVPFRLFCTTDGVRHMPSQLDVVHCRKINMYTTAQPNIKVKTHHQWAGNRCLFAEHTPWVWPCIIHRVCSVRCYACSGWLLSLLSSPKCRFDLFPNIGWHPISSPNQDAVVCVCMRLLNSIPIVKHNESRVTSPANVCSYRLVHLVNPSIPFFIYFRYHFSVFIVVYDAAIKCRSMWMRVAASINIIAGCVLLCIKSLRAPDLWENQPINVNQYVIWQSNTDFVHIPWDVNKFGRRLPFVADGTMTQLTPTFEFDHNHTIHSK